MIVRVGIENNNDGRSIAWALDHPGCFAYGRDAVEARANMHEAVDDYAAWVRGHGASWLDGVPFEIQIEETFDAHMAYGDPSLVPEHGQNTLIESFFRYDAEPLTGADVERAFKLLEWGRQDLLNTIAGLSEQKLNEKRDGERWSINGILQHVAHAEWWYQERVSPPSPEHEEDLPAEARSSLELVRAHLTSLLPKLENVQLALDLEGETWSPRKMLRRAAWHERDHTEHIRKLSKGVAVGPDAPPRVKSSFRKPRKE